jgi:hypothetical protein
MKELDLRKLLIAAAVALVIFVAVLVAAAFGLLR